MKLHLDKEVFEQIIEGTSDYMSIPEEFIEKDYYVSLLLSQITSKFPEIIFKGGTSLSKCYGLIKRFSEDIDITVNTSHITNRLKRDLKQSILDAIENSGLKLTNSENIKTRMNYNQYSINYSSIIEPSGNLRDHLLLETYLSTKTYPTEVKKVSSFVSHFLRKNGYDSLISKYELQSFEVKVQAVVRTLIDKLFAICDYLEKDQIRQNSRHLYDIHQIWSNNEFDKIEFRKLFDKVAIDRSSNPTYNISSNKDYNIIRTLNKIITDRVYEKDYQEITENLLFRNHHCSYDESITSLKDIIDKGFIPSRIGQTV